MDRRELASIAVERTRMPMVVTDPRQPDNPIVLANKSFLELTGYRADEVLGRNCRFLQGEDTSRETIAQIRDAIAAPRVLDIDILNYRKDGTSFWNRLHLDPIHDDQGRLIYIFASQVDVSESRRLASLEAAEHRLLKEVDHRAMNVLAIVEGIVRLSKAENAAHYAASVQRRVHALARAHTILAHRRWKDVPLAQLIEVQVEPFGARRVTLDGPQVLLVGHVVQPLALVFHELIANAATHGALSHASGRVEVQWAEDKASSTVDLAWHEHGGPPPPAERAPGFGSTMIKAIVRRQLRGSLRRSWEAGGLKAHLSIPMDVAA